MYTVRYSFVHEVFTIHDNRINNSFCHCELTHRFDHTKVPDVSKMGKKPDQIIHHLSQIHSPILND